MYFIQTGTIIEDGQTSRDNRPPDTAAVTKSDAEKLEGDIGSEDQSRAEVAAESDVNVDPGDSAQAESAKDKPTEAEKITKTEPTEEIEVEVEEFYVKYKNL